jgi:hypothetical protein
VIAGGEGVIAEDGERGGETQFSRFVDQRSALMVCETVRADNRPIDGDPLAVQGDEAADAHAARIEYFQRNARHPITLTVTSTSAPRRGSLPCDTCTVAVMRCPFMPFGGGAEMSAVMVTSM